MGCATKAKIKKYRVIESNDCIYYYHNPDPSEIPTWIPPEKPEINNKKFTFHGICEHFIPIHIRDIPENGADVEHLNVLHKIFIFPQVSPPLGHTWEASWTVPDKEFSPHITQIDLVEHTTIFEKVYKFLDVKVTINQVGPGIVWLMFDTPFFGKAWICGTVTPIAPLLQHARHMIWSQWSMPRPIAKLLLLSLVSQFEHDISVWSWKSSLKHPTLTKRDTTIKKFRTWFSQFYSKHSMSFNDAVEEYNKRRMTLPDW